MERADTRAVRTSVRHLVGILGVAMLAYSAGFMRAFVLDDLNNDTLLHQITSYRSVLRPVP